MIQTTQFNCLMCQLFSGGWLPFSVVLTTDAIYQLFYDVSDRSKAFLHSHTYSGNALGASLALATLTIIESDNDCARVRKLQAILYAHRKEIADKTQLLQNVRAIGAIVAADFVFAHNEQYNQRLAQKAAEMGALIRPIGNTLYWLPPEYSATNLARFKGYYVTGDVNYVIKYVIFAGVGKRENTGSKPINFHCAFYTLKPLLSLPYTWLYK